MKKSLTLLAIGLLASTALLRAADEAKAPYPVTTCIVSGEKLGGDMGKPYVFIYEGQEVQLCCKSCKKDFDQDPAKYLKALEDASKTSK